MEVLFEIGWRAIATALAIVRGARVGEHSRARMASVVITFPMNAGPGFLFMAWDQSAPFISDAALAGFAGTGAVVAFAAGYVRAAPFGGLSVRLCAGVLCWLALALPMLWLPPTLPSAIGLILLGAVLVKWLMPPVVAVLTAANRAPWSYLIARGVLAGLVVASVAGAATILGPTLAGLAYAFPTTTIAAVWVLHRRYGPTFAVTVVAGMPGSMASYAGFVLTLYLTSGPLAPLAAWATAALAAIVIAGSRALFVHNRHRAADA
ncbi:MAG: hypothetical protein AAF637_00615 [Pseudomonadota bacterium]